MSLCHPCLKRSLNRCAVTECLIVEKTITNGRAIKQGRTPNETGLDGGMSLIFASYAVIKLKTFIIKTVTLETMNRKIFLYCVVAATWKLMDDLKSYGLILTEIRFLQGHAQPAVA